LTWNPITAEGLQKLIEAELSAFSPAEAAGYERTRVPLRAGSIRRDGNVEQAFVVAELDGTVVYYEDVEEGFNLSGLDAQGFIASPGYEQWQLRHAINRLLG
jgi:hypothetical protein